MDQDRKTGQQASANQDPARAATEPSGASRLERALFQRKVQIRLKRRGESPEPAPAPAADPGDGTKDTAPTKDPGASDQHADSQASAGQAPPADMETLSQQVGAKGVHKTALETVADGLNLPIKALQKLAVSASTAVAAVQAVQAASGEQVVDLAKAATWDRITRNGVTAEAIVDEVVKVATIANYNITARNAEKLSGKDLLAGAALAMKLEAEGAVKGSATASAEFWNAYADLKDGKITYDQMIGRATGKLSPTDDGRMAPWKAPKDPVRGHRYEAASGALGFGEGGGHWNQVGGAGTGGEGKTTTVKSTEQPGTKGVKGGDAPLGTGGDRRPGSGGSLTGTGGGKVPGGTGGTEATPQVGTAPSGSEESTPGGSATGGGSQTQVQNPGPSGGGSQPSQQGDLVAGKGPEAPAGQTNIGAGGTDHEGGTSSGGELDLGALSGGGGEEGGDIKITITGVTHDGENTTITFTRTGGEDGQDGTYTTEYFQSENSDGTTTGMWETTNADGDSMGTGRGDAPNVQPGDSTNTTTDNGQTAVFGGGEQEEDPPPSDDPHPDGGDEGLIAENADVGGGGGPMIRQFGGGVTDPGQNSEQNGPMTPGEVAANVKGIGARGGAADGPEREEGGGSIDAKRLEQVTGGGVKDPSTEGGETTPGGNTPVMPGEFAGPGGPKVSTVGGDLAGASGGKLAGAARAVAALKGGQGEH